MCKLPVTIAKPNECAEANSAAKDKYIQHDWADILATIKNLNSNESHGWDDLSMR